MRCRPAFVAAKTAMTRAPVNLKSDRFADPGDLSRPNSVNCQHYERLIQKLVPHFTKGNWTWRMNRGMTFEFAE